MRLSKPVPEGDATGHGAPVEDFPVVRPFWRWPVLYLLIAGAQLVVFWALLLICVVPGIPLEQGFKDPVVRVLLVLVELLCLAFAWAKTCEWADDHHQQACFRWYLKHPRQFLQQLDGQVSGERILKASELELVHLNVHNHNFHAHCLNRQEQLIHIVASRWDTLQLRTVEVVSPSTVKAHILQHDRQACLRLLDTPEHW